MPEIRFNPSTKEWVIIATERAKRPEDFVSKSYSISSDSAANCPFCLGREQKTPGEIFAIRDKGTQPNSPGWQVRVIPNAFPALKSEGEIFEEKTPAGFTKMSGVGKHEVIIESPAHEQIIATMDQPQVDNIFKTYQERFRALIKDPRFKSIILFKNHGHNAGTSLYHPHSQLIALPIIPHFFRARMEVAQEHFEKNKTCLICDLTKMEKAEKERIVLETDNFIVYEPFASRVPFETWVVPKKHVASFVLISEKDCKELASVMKNVLTRIYKELKNPDFNYAFYSAIHGDNSIVYYHWNIKIFPRFSNPAGFEIGSGMMINTMAPELAAKYLRGA